MVKHEIFTRYCLAAVLVALNLIAFNILVSREPLFRLDLTEDREYSLTRVTKDLVRDIEEDLYIYGYFSERTHPKLAALVPEIEDLAREYGVLSGRRIQVLFSDPRNDDRIAEEAKQRFGVNPVPVNVPGKYENAWINTYYHVVVAYGDQYVRYEPRDLIEVRVEEWEPIVTLGNLEYSLTKAIKKVLYGFQSVEAVFVDLDDEVEVLAWISKEEELPESFREIPTVLRTVCDEMAAKSGGKFRFVVSEPPKDAREREALHRSYQVRPFSLGFFDSRSFYCGAVMRFGERVATLNLLGEETVSEASIRESIHSTLTRLVPGFLKTVGLVIPEPEMPPQMQMQQRPPPRDFQVLSRFLHNDYNVKDVSLEDGVGADVEALFVLKPVNLSEDAVFELDQYLMRGGRVILAVDRFEVDVESMRMGQLGVREIENPPLYRWLSNLGVSHPKKLLEDDRNVPYVIPHRQRLGAIEVETLQEVMYPWFPVAAGDGVSSDHPAVKGLEAVTMYWASPLEVDEERTADLEVATLLRSSEKSWSSPNTIVAPPASVLDAREKGRDKRWYEIPDDASSQAMAVALVGSFASYFAEHAPPGETAPPEETPEEESGEEAGDDAGSDGDADAGVPKKAFLTQSPETRLVVLGDAELFSERTFQATGRAQFDWTQAEFEGNLVFAQNLVDWALLDNDMIRIRTRGTSARPLNLESGSPGFVEAMSYVVPCGVVILLGFFRLVQRRRRKPVALEVSIGSGRGSEA